MIINSYQYGSYVYGTNDEHSDRDLIIIDEQKDDEFQVDNITYYSINGFQKLLDAHDVCAVECFFLPDNKKSETYKFNFQLDKTKLRKSFSSVSSNSWVKAKKKIDIHKEYHIGMKSLFHSLRILEFGICLAEYGCIKYNCSNDLWVKIKEQNFNNWGQYKDYWKEIYNGLKTDFRICCPMEE